ERVRAAPLVFGAGAGDHAALPAGGDEALHEVEAGDAPGLVRGIGPKLAVFRGPGEMEQMARADRRDGGGDRGAVEQVDGVPMAGRLIERAAGDTVDLEAKSRQRRQRLAADIAAGPGDEDAGHADRRRLRLPAPFSPLSPPRKRGPRASDEFFGPGPPL